MITKNHHQILPRRNISRIIDTASLNEAVCMVAPYGYGKTLAVVSWLLDSGRKAAYLSLKESHNSDLICLSYLTAEILSLTGAKPPTSLGNPMEYLHEALSRADEGLQEKILIIDNFHFIRNEDLLIFIKNFIHSLLGRWRVIMISRAELPPVFNDLILKGHICLVSFSELSFSQEEMQQFFQMNGHTVTEDDITEIHKSIQGWPAALNAILTAARDGPLNYNETARAYISSFFETEIWKGMDEKKRDFLLKTSVLDVLSPSSTYAVTGVSETLPILRWLFLNGIFISKLTRKEEYRYHLVFREFLQEKLSASDLNERELYLKVAWWLFEREEIVQSFPYFFKAKDLYGISRVLQILDPANIGVEKFIEVFQCITELDISELKLYPVIVARIAIISYMTGNIERMQELYRTLTEWIEPGFLSISPEEYAEYIWEAGWLCYLNPDEELYQNKRHEEWCNYKEYVPHLNARHTARSGMLAYPSCLRGLRDYSHIAHEIEPFLRQAEIMGQSTIREERSICQMKLMVAEYAYETENFSKAKEFIMDVMALTKERYADLYFVCIVLFIKILRATNDVKEIDALINNLETTIDDHKAFFLLPNFHAFQSLNRLYDGQTGLTEEFEKENINYEDKPYTFRIYRHFVLARGLISTGDYNRALMILGNLDSLCQKCNNVMSLIEINILKSVIFYCWGEQGLACACLADALITSEKFGYIRIYSDEISIWPILNLVRKQTKGDYVKNIIISCKKSLANSGHKMNKNRNYVHTELTKAELNILKSLEAGMSYKEIAMEKHIQVSTVKSHVHSVYSKLDVTNKTSAIVVAQATGILE